MSASELKPSERRMLEKLRAMPDEAIDTIDIPEAPLANWAGMRRKLVVSIT
jgi:hypothetical protein